ncbi:MAG: hypothetical protein AMJ55_09295 [Gammaproteobacteria bacterium SG8_15]|nr:MAG: hypothetical protein AMJ55_09295 [Gammaproteobacteria bacterium SG8_15]
MSFKKVYQNTVVQEGYHKDGAQAMMADYLESVYSDLVQRQYGSASLAKELAAIFRRRRGGHKVKGCYIWGGVGLGKTWLMDLFFDCMPLERKARFHFHEFMQRIHAELASLKRQRDPLKLVARSLVTEAQLICLDEFHVQDITDAMLLHGLLQAMYHQGAVFIMTSNVMPDELYLNGLQRSQFLPAIELIKNRNHVCQLEGNRDYRLRKHHNNRNYYCPIDPNTDRLLEERFSLLASGVINNDSTLVINDRRVHVRAHVENIVWFDFDEICGGPRATIDYIHLAQRFAFVMISNVYIMNEENDDMARRFINLVDELYDSDTGLILSATGLPDELYSGQRFAREFERTISRLQEMRAKDLAPFDSTSKQIDRIARLS